MSLLKLPVAIQHSFYLIAAVIKGIGRNILAMPLVIEIKKVSYKQVNHCIKMTIATSDETNSDSFVMGLSCDWLKSVGWPQGGRGYSGILVTGMCE